MDKITNRASLFLSKFHRWGGLFLAFFIIFYSVTGILLNHRKHFDYFITKENTVLKAPVSDIDGLNSFIDFYKQHINRQDDPKVIRIKDNYTIQFLYGSHGSTTYTIKPLDGVMEKSVKKHREPFTFFNNLHKAFKSSMMWIVLSDILSLSLIGVTIAALITLRYRVMDYIFLFAGSLIFVIILLI